MNRIVVASSKTHHGLAVATVSIYIYIYIYILEREPRISLDTPEAYTGLRKIGILERGGGGGKKARMTIKHSHAR
jgi:hypothetical protein